MMGFVRGLAIGLFLLVLVSCAPTADPTAGGADSAANGSAAAVAESLAAGGLPCNDMSSRPGQVNVATEVRCTIGADDVIIRAFASREDRDRFMEASGTFEEQLSFDLDAPPRIVGPTWIVTTDTKATAEKIGAILGGELR